MDLQDNKITLRPIQLSDRNNLAKLANNINVCQNLRDGFPHPYTLEHADNYINACLNEPNIAKKAIEYNGQFVGIVGLVLTKEVYRKTAEVGYWVGEPFWGKGIATSAVKLITTYAFEVLKMKRVHAGVYSYNDASKRVLEKCSYEFEGIFKSVTIKNNRFVDEWRYAIINKSTEKELLQ